MVESEPVVVVEAREVFGEVWAHAHDSTWHREIVKAQCQFKQLKYIRRTFVTKRVRGCCP